MSWKCKVKFKIINGRVFDPTQKLDNKKKDIFVKDGQIVKPSPSEVCEYKTTYDVEGMIVMAGAIDIHSHIAGGNVNNARLLSPEIHTKFVESSLNRKKTYLVLILGGPLMALVIDILKWDLQQWLSLQFFQLILF